MNVFNFLGLLINIVYFFTKFLFETYSEVSFIFVFLWFPWVLFRVDFRLALQVWIQIGWLDSTGTYNKMFVSLIIMIIFCRLSEKQDHW